MSQPTPQLPQWTIISAATGTYSCTGPDGTVWKITDTGDGSSYLLTSARDARIIPATSGLYLVLDLAGLVVIGITDEDTATQLLGL